jgi:serine protease
MSRRVLPQVPRMKLRTGLLGLAGIAAIATLGLPPAIGVPEPVTAVPPKRYSYGAAGTDQIIVHLRDEAPVAAGELDRRTPMSADRARDLSVAAQVDLRPLRAMSGGAQVLKLARAMSIEEVEQIAARLKTDPTVADAAPDRRKVPMQVTDPEFSRQWNLLSSSSAGGGMNAVGAWGTGFIGNAVVVAVLDTGVVTFNQDLGGSSSRFVTGYDLIRADASSAFGSFATSNDGDAEDPDPGDPGNWILGNEAGQVPFQDCTSAVNSDWHGTHISGIIAAKANNGFGGAGIAYRASVMPVRVLGKCGGYTSDIVDGIRWSAGLSIPRVPFLAPFPAKVINLSLGGSGACTAAEQNAINDAHAAGVVAIVAAAGNEATLASNVSPANCTNVVAVAACASLIATARARRIPISARPPS